MQRFNRFPVDASEGRCVLTGNVNKSVGVFELFLDGSNSEASDNSQVIFSARFYTFNFRQSSDCVARMSCIRIVNTDCAFVIQNTFHLLIGRLVGWLVDELVSLLICG